MNGMGSRKGKVVVNRSVSIDGFIAAPGDEMGWVFESLPTDAPIIGEIASETGAMLVGRRTYDVGKRMQAAEPGSSDYPSTGSTFLLTHRPPDPPDPGVIILSGDIGEAVATALESAGGKNVEILGADVAAQAFRRGLVDEVLLYVIPVVLGGGVPFSPAGAQRVDLEPISSTQVGRVSLLRFRVRKGT